MLAQEVGESIDQVELTQERELDPRDLVRVVVSRVLAAIDADLEVENDSMMVRVARYVLPSSVVKSGSS